MSRDRRIAELQKELGLIAPDPRDAALKLALGALEYSDSKLAHDCFCVPPVDFLGAEDTTNCGIHTRIRAALAAIREVLSE